MCLLAVYYRLIDAAPVLVAANREERYDRPALPPKVHEGSPRVVCGTDEEAGGTWLGVNERGLLVAVTNRAKARMPASPRSRGLLCRDLLACGSAAEATQQAERELARGRYDGANFLCLDARSAAAVHGGDRVERIDLEPGLHLMTNGDLDDAGDQRLAGARGLFETAAPTSSESFVAAARRICAHPSVIERRPHSGTVCSDVVALTTDPAGAVYLHAPGPPDQRAYEDYSASLRAVLEGHGGWGRATEGSKHGGPRRATEGGNG